MKKKLAVLAVAGASLGLFAVGAPSASAAHCADNGGPGNSDFASHVQNGSDRAEGGHRGWSSCQETSANYVAP